jgi:hypothetical protein
MDNREHAMIRNLALAAGGMALSASAWAALVDPVPVPSSLQAFADEEPVLGLSVAGMQRYECRALANSPNRFLWAWLGPDAALFDGQQRQVARFAAGPRWQGLDGGQMLGRVRASTASPTPGNVPWEIFVADSATTGLFTGVTAVQQVNTEGGLPPDTPCAERNLGQQAESPFRAEQILYRKKPSG